MEHRWKLSTAAWLAHAMAIGVAACLACGAFAADKPKPRQARALGETRVITMTMENGCLRFSDLAPHARKGDVVYWVNQTGATLTIRFTGASPFKKHHAITIEDGDIGGGVIDKDPGAGAHQDHFYVTFPAACVHTMPGPDVIVDGGSIGPPPKKR